MLKLHKSVLVGLVIIVLTSCSNLIESTSIPTPDIGIDVQTEKYLEIIAPNGWNSFKTNEPITLQIRNISKNPIVSPSGLDFGARLFIRTEEGWVEVRNKQGYDYYPITVEPNIDNDPLKMSATAVFPELPDSSVSTLIRVYLVATLMENGQESRKVASYIELMLNP